MVTPDRSTRPVASPQSSRRRFSIRGLLLGLIVGLVLLTLVSNAIQFALRSPVVSPPPNLQTAQRLEQLQDLIQRYVDENQRLPGDTLSEAVASLAESGVDFDSPELRVIADGRDYWDSPFIYEQTDRATLVLRSIGSNRRHEHGGGDDIQRIVKLEP